MLVGLEGAQSFCVSIFRRDPPAAYLSLLAALNAERLVLVAAMFGQLEHMLNCFARVLTYPRRSHAGRMFWFMWKKFVGSNFALICRRRG
jgi:hypothetical protein